MDNCVAESFESSTIHDPKESCLIDLDNILDGLDCSDDLAQLGVDIDYSLFLKSIKLPSNEKRPLVADVNAVIYSLMSPEHSAAFKKFFNIQWNRVYEKVKECVLSQKDRRIERKNFTSLFGELHLLCVSGMNSAIICKIKEISTHLKEARVACLNMRALKNCKSDLIEISLKELSSSDFLKIEWRELFPADANIELVDEPFFGVVSRYMNMAGAQFLRDF